MLELARLAYLPALLEAEAFSDPSPHQRALRFAEFIGRARSSSLTAFDTRMEISCCSRLATSTPRDDWE